jgi:CHAT domain-containing protein
LSYYYEGRNDQAIHAFQRALRLYEKLPDRVRISQVLNNIALAEYSLGRSASAAQRYMAALRGLKSSEAPQPYAFILNNLGLAHFELGQYDAALREFSQALDLWRAAQNVREQARSLQGIGNVFDAVGDQDQALYYYRAAFGLRGGNIDVRGRVASLRTIASLIRERGDLSGALRLHEEALTLAATPAIRARLTAQIAMDLEGLGRHREAIGRIATALAQLDNDPVSRAMLVLQRSRVSSASGQVRESQLGLRSALRTFKQYELTGLEFEGWLALATAQRNSGAIADALTSIDRALACAEMLRVQSANPELRATLLQPLRPAYELKIALLSGQFFGHPADAASDLLLAALSTAELARARALEDFQSVDMRAPGVAPELLVRRDETLRALATQRNQLEVRLERAATDDPRVLALRAGIAESRRQLVQIDAQLASTESQHRSAIPRTLSGRMTRPGSMPADLAIIEYWLGGGQSLAWVLTRERITMIALEPGARINQAAIAFHAGLRNIATQTAADRLRLSGALYDLILRPIAPLLAGKRSLVFAPDGALHYVSFAALRPNDAPAGRFLIQDHDISVTPSIAMLGRSEPPVAALKPGKELLLVTDPVYQAADSRVIPGIGNLRMAQADSGAADEPRFGAIPGNLQRLPGTAAEGRAIAALLPAAKVDVLEGFAATREQFLAAALGQYRLIHVATHGLVDTQVPQLSSLILSTRDRQGRPLEGRVLAADFMAVRLSADVVVLSACDTALGKNVLGEGLIGLRYVILARGARAVVASLWAVPDKMGARLVAKFYKSMIQGRMKVASALSAAMREVLLEDGSDPALWAAFDVTLRDSSV